MARILVTGGAGFIGSNCCNILARGGHEVIAFDDFSLGAERNLDAGVRMVRGDVRDAGALDAVGPVEHVIHLASASSAPMFADDLVGSAENNIIGHVQVMEYARRHGVQKMLYASTSSMYGDNPIPLSEDQHVEPPNFYAVTKHAQEELSHVHHRVYGTELIGFRFMSVYGPHEEHKGRFANLVSQFIWGIEQGKPPVLYGDGTQTRDFVNVQDVVAAFQHALGSEKRFGSAIFNVGTTHAVSLIDLTDIINASMGTDLKPVLVPNPITSGYIKNQQADLTKINRELGYQPSVSLEEGIREIVALRRQGAVAPTSLSF